MCTFDALENGSSNAIEECLANICTTYCIPVPNWSHLLLSQEYIPKCFHTKLWNLAHKNKQTPLHFSSYGSHTISQPTPKPISQERSKNTESPALKTQYIHKKRFAAARRAKQFRKHISNLDRIPLYDKHIYRPRNKNRIFSVSAHGGLVWWWWLQVGPSELERVCKKSIVSTRKQQPLTMECRCQPVRWLVRPPACTHTNSQLFHYYDV
jgi:hypothetical protein